MYKRIILIFMVLVIIFSISVPFASAADGETKSVQYYNYNGIVIPDITPVWNEQEYPYVLMYRPTSITEIRIYFSSRPLVYDYTEKYFCTDDTGNTNYYIVYLPLEEYDYIFCGDVAWKVGNPYLDVSYKTLQSYFASCKYWSNYDIDGLNDGEEIFLHASEPVLDKLVDYNVEPSYAAALFDYNGIVVPNIETLEQYNLSDYPYVFMWEKDGKVCLRLLKDKPFYGKNGYLYYSSSGYEISCTRTLCAFSNGLPWGSGNEKAVTANRLVFAVDDRVYWANCDIYDTDGTLFYTSVAPVPVDSPDVGGGGSGGGGDVEIADITFFNNILSLFTSTFDAVTGDEYFRFLIYFVSVEVAFGLFFFITKGSKKL